MDKVFLHKATKLKINLTIRRIAKGKVVIQFCNTMTIKVCIQVGCVLPALLLYGGCLPRKGVCVKGDGMVCPGSVCPRWGVFQTKECWHTPPLPHGQNF